MVREIAIYNSRHSGDLHFHKIKLDYYKIEDSDQFNKIHLSILGHLNCI